MGKYAQNGNLSSMIEDMVDEIIEKEIENYKTKLKTKVSEYFSDSNHFNSDTEKMICEKELIELIDES